MRVLKQRQDAFKVVGRRCRPLIEHHDGMLLPDQ